MALAKNTDKFTEDGRRKGLEFSIESVHLDQVDNHVGFYRTLFESMYIFSAV